MILLHQHPTCPQSRTRYTPPSPLTSACQFRLLSSQLGRSVCDWGLFQLGVREWQCATGRHGPQMPLVHPATASTSQCARLAVPLSVADEGGVQLTAVYDDSVRSKVFPGDRVVAIDGERGHMRTHTCLLNTSRVVSPAVTIRMLFRVSGRCRNATAECDSVQSDGAA